MFLFLPAVVATMDRPPFHLGGKILLWLGTWFLVRRLPDDERARVLAGLQVLRRPLALLVFLAGLALVGASLALFGGLDRFQPLTPVTRGLSGALLLSLYAVTVSLPVVLLTWAYIPVRFARSVWLPRGLVAFLPVAGFTLLHVSTLDWKAPLVALVCGSLAWIAGKGRLPLVAVVVGHAIVACVGIAGGLW